eukprot:6187066-Pleurochrysis_carterae.AAC.2
MLVPVSPLGTYRRAAWRGERDHWELGAEQQARAQLQRRRQLHGAADRLCELRTFARRGFRLIGMAGEGRGRRKPETCGGDGEG